MKKDFNELMDSLTDEQREKIELNKTMTKSFLKQMADNRLTIEEGFFLFGSVMNQICNSQGEPLTPKQIRYEFDSVRDLVIKISESNLKDRKK